MRGTRKSSSPPSACGELNHIYTISVFLHVTSQAGYMRGHGGDKLAFGLDDFRVFSSLNYSVILYVRK